jgi:CRISPR-associated protein Csx17
VLDEVAVGQFAPALAGGGNMTAGFDAEGRVNPWDFVLTLEGAIFFAGASVRRLDAGAFGSASFPFHVRASAVGYGSSADADEGGARSELWLPLWPQPASCVELRMLFAEGRIDIDRRRARSGLDAVRALAGLGVDRGIDTFQRIAFLKRNGLAFLAATLGSFEVRADPRVELLSDLDGLLRDALGGIAATAAGLRALRTAVFDAARQHRPLTAVLAAAGALERAVSRSKKAREAVFRPSAMLSKEWLEAADDGSHEFALAAAVASWGVREQLEPVDPVKLRWVSARPVWTGAEPLRGIVAVALDKLRSAQHRNVPLEGRWSVSGEALMALLTGRLDREKLEDLIFGLSLVGMGPWTKPFPQESTEPPPSTFALLRAVTSPRFLVENDRHPATKVIPAILARLHARDLEGALRLATQRLRGSRCRIKATVRGVHGRLDFDALSAALVIPLSPRLEENLVSRVVERAHEEGD